MHVAGLYLFIRFLFYGPVVGAMVGFILAGAEIRDWDENGRPNTYIRGTEGMDLAMAFWVAGGAIVGIPFGAVIATFEYVTGR